MELGAGGWILLLDKGDEIHDELLIAADLINRKKHGGNENQSGVDPWLDDAKLDTRKSGGLELWYQGSVKEMILLVTSPDPIPYRVDVYPGFAARAGSSDPPDQRECLGSAAQIIFHGFQHWLPLVKDLGVLDGGDAESEALRDIIRPVYPSI